MVATCKQRVWQAGDQPDGFVIGSNIQSAIKDYR